VLEHIHRHVAFAAISRQFWRRAPDDSTWVSRPLLDFPTPIVLPRFRMVSLSLIGRKRFYMACVLSAAVSTVTRFLCGLGARAWASSVLFVFCSIGRGRVLQPSEQSILNDTFVFSV